jgi:hypothetical protein
LIATCGFHFDLHCQHAINKVVVKSIASLQTAIILAGLLIGFGDIILAVLGYGSAPFLNRIITFLLVGACVSTLIAILLRLQVIGRDILSILDSMKPDEGSPQENEEAMLMAIARGMMASSGGVEVKNRRYRLNVYPNSFVGSEAVDWLVNYDGRSRASAVALGQWLLTEGFIQHVTNDHEFEDGYLFYRFNPERIQAAETHALSSVKAATVNFDALAEAMRQESEGVEIKDRRYYLNTYAKCFVGSEAVDWIMQNQQCSRAEAVELGQVLVDRKIIHHVTDEHGFEDNYFFYRFYADEPESMQAERRSQIRAKLANVDFIALIEAMRGEGGLDIRDRRYHLNVYAKCFVGSETVDWLAQHENLSRAEAIELGQLMVEKQIIHHVSNDHDFEDGYLFYRFCADEPERFANRAAEVATASYPMD